MEKNTTQEVLIADIGGTNARFALAKNQCYAHLKVLNTSHYTDFTQALQDYLSFLRTHKIYPSRAVFAVAAPITNEYIHFTNSPWSLDLAKIRQLLACEVMLMNDFEAQALALWVPELKTTSLNVASGQNPLQHRPAIERRLVLGPGTGLGVAYTVGENIISTEAGHTTLVSQTPQEYEIFNYFQAAHGHVSAERACSGPGIEALYTFYTGQVKDAQSIHQTALKTPNSGEAKALAQFFRYFGTVAGQLALSLDATSGVYLTGGITNKLSALFESSDFMARFTRRGRFSNYLQQIPVWIIQEREPALTGMAYRYT